MSAQTDFNHAQIIVDCGPQRLHCLKWGEGDHHAVLLHGFPDMRAMKPLACRLAKAVYTVPLFRGYAPTPAHDGRYDLLALTEDIRRHSVLKPSSILRGNDWGGDRICCEHYGSLIAVLGLSVPPVPDLQATLPLSRQLAQPPCAYQIDL